jgi:hypothetical protein
MRAVMGLQERVNKVECLSVLDDTRVIPDNAQLTRVTASAPH